MSWSGRFLTAMFAFSVLSLSALKLLHLIGVDLIQPTIGGPPVPFSRAECIHREESRYFARNSDMTELSEDQIETVARVCAEEESEHYYGTEGPN